MDLEDRGLMTPAGRRAFKTRPHWSHLRWFLDILDIIQISIYLTIRESEFSSFDSATHKQLIINA